MSSEHRTLTVGSEPVEYQVTRSVDATEPRIDVGMHGVTIVLPTDSELDPDQLLHENSSWVLEKKKKYDSYREDAPERQFQEGETFPYLGEEYELVIEPRSQAEVSGETLRLRQSAVEQSSTKRALENFYRRRAREHLVSRADHYAEEMGVEYNKIEIRNQRTKWGSCSTSGTLGLNWRLMMAPPNVIDYIVVHELAHLREANHTDEFWRLVANHCPDYQDHVAWLTENSARLIFDTTDL